MKLLTRWLREHLDTALTDEALLERFALLGIEVEDVRDLGEGLRDHVVVGEITQVEPHPRLSHLRVAHTHIGTETLELVSAAPNVRPGIRVAVALPGARLPSGEKIEVRTFEGIPSRGMLLSEAELELAEASEGILELPPDLEVGASPLSYLERDGLWVDLYITPNRPDLMGVRGLARELALLEGELLPVNLDFPTDTSISALPVHVEDPEDCAFYLGATVEGVASVPSPPVFRYRLALVGIPSYSLPVDLTNYVLLEMGHPLHAFDADQLEGGIVVRRAHPEEKLQTLDEQERTLDPSLLIIADHRKPVALAGVLGGRESGVQEGTRRILLESAVFAPPLIREAVLRFGLSTEAARRFERGMTVSSAKEAASRFLHLLHQHQRTVRIAPPVVVGSEPEPRTLVFRTSRFHRIAGVHLDGKELEQVLRRLAPDVKPHAQGWEVLLPSHRVDLHREEDLIEEVLRLVGYDRIPAEPEQGSSFVGYRPPRDRNVHPLLQGLGYTRVVSVEFASEEEVRPFAPSERWVRIANPLGERYRYLRTSLIPGLLQAVRRNLHARQPWIALYEVGTVFLWKNPESLPEEPARLAVVLSGSGETRPHAGILRPDFWEIRAVLDMLVERFGLSLRWEKDKPDFLREGSRFTLGDLPGWIGELSTPLLRRFEIKQPVYALEWTLPPHLTPLRTFRNIPTFPEARRDVSLLVEKRKRYAELRDLLWKERTEHLTHIQLVDVYEGDPLPPDRRSLTFALTYLAPDRTLTDEEVDREFWTLIERLRAKGLTIRGV